MKNLYTKIFVLKKYMEKTKEIPWNMKHRFHEANLKIPRIKTNIQIAQDLLFCWFPERKKKGKAAHPSCLVPLKGVHTQSLKSINGIQLTEQTRMDRIDRDWLRVTRVQFLARFFSETYAIT